MKFANEWRNYNSAQDWLNLIQKGLKIWFFTGEYDAMTPTNGFEDMLENVGYNHLKNIQPKKLSYGWMKKHNNVAVLEINYGGHDIQIRNPTGTFLVLKEFLSDYELIDFQ